MSRCPDTMYIEILIQCYVPFVRVKGLLCEGFQEAPILHLRLLEPFETFEEDEEKLKEIVAIVSCFFSHLITKVSWFKFIRRQLLSEFPLLRELL